MPLTPINVGNLGVLGIDCDPAIEKLQRGLAVMQFGMIAPEENPTEEGAAQLGQVLLNMGKIDETALAAALAYQFGIPLADLSHEKPDPVAVDMLPEELARRHTVVAQPHLCARM